MLPFNSHHISSISLEDEDRRKETAFTLRAFFNGVEQTNLRCLGDSKTFPEYPAHYHEKVRTLSELPLSHNHLRSQYIRASSKGSGKVEAKEKALLEVGFSLISVLLMRLFDETKSQQWAIFHCSTIPVCCCFSPFHDPSHHCLLSRLDSFFSFLTITLISSSLPPPPALNNGTDEQL